MAPARPSFWNSVCSRIIYGFASREHCVKVLKDQADGTFLLRFSESFLSGNYINSKGGLVVVIQKDGKWDLTSSAHSPSPPPPHLPTHLLWCWDEGWGSAHIEFIVFICLCVCVSEFCSDGIFWTAWPFVTKLGMLVHQYEPEGTVACYLQGQGHSKGSCNQNVTASAIYFMYFCWTADPVCF